MRAGIPFPTANTLAKSAQVFTYGTADWAAVIAGTAASTDISRYVRGGSHDAGSATLDLVGLNPVPSAGMIARIYCYGLVVFTGFVADAKVWGVQRGETSCTLTLRTREQIGIWKDTTFSSDTYPLGTRIVQIAEDAMVRAGVTRDNMILPAASNGVPHSNVAMSDMPIWQMVEQLYLPLGVYPSLLADGRVGYYSKNIQRNPDLLMPWNRVLSAGGSQNGTPISALQVKWLDPILQEVSQQQQMVGKTSITAGFFTLDQWSKVIFSPDGHQRVRSTRMKVLESVNRGLVPVGIEVWCPHSDRNGTPSEFMGYVHVISLYWVPILATLSLWELKYWAEIGDEVVGIGQLTIPIGAKERTRCLCQILFCMMSIGTGQYEIWGEPYDYVHAINTTEVYDSAAPGWRRAEVEMRCDLIEHEVHAQALATMEFLYRYYSAWQATAEIVDYPAIEVGDILEFEDHSRFFVTDYRRDITRGSRATLKLSGFRC